MEAEEFLNKYADLIAECQKEVRKICNDEYVDDLEEGIIIGGIRFQSVDGQLAMEK